MRGVGGKLGGRGGGDAAIPEALPFDKGERLKTFRHLGRLFAQMWRTSPWLMGLSIVLRVIVAVQPPLVLLLTKLIIDEVLKQTALGVPGPELGDRLQSGLGDGLSEFSRSRSGRGRLCLGQELRGRRHLGQCVRGQRGIGHGGAAVGVGGGIVAAARGVGIIASCPKRPPLPRPLQTPHVNAGRTARATPRWPRW